MNWIAALATFLFIYAIVNLCASYLYYQENRNEHNWQSQITGWLGIILICLSVGLFLS